MSSRILLHGITGPTGTRLRRLLPEGLRPPARFRPLVGSFDSVIVAVSGPAEPVRAAGEGLPEGVAHAEAVAVRLRRRDADLEWGDPQVVDDVGRLLELCHARGRSSVEVARADPSLTTELQLGGWFNAGWRMRALRRAALLLPGRTLRLWLPRTPTALRVAADLAFWRGVRVCATAAEWQRLTRSSYVALVYHRLAGELKPGQERIDLAPEVFARQLEQLQRFGFRHLRSDELLTFHENPDAVLPGRSFVVTVDDGLSDCLPPLLEHAGMGPLLFVPTRELGGRAHWLDGEPVMTWDDVRSLANAGVAVGAHGQHHRRLGGLEAAELVAELEGALSDVRSQLDAPLELLAYPNGDHDAEVRRAASECGFRAAFTTEKGRNGAGTDIYCLRRISVHGADGSPAVLWKAATGEALPGVWLRLRALRLHLRAAAARARPRAVHEEADSHL